MAQLLDELAARDITIHNFCEGQRRTLGRGATVALEREHENCADNRGRDFGVDLGDRVLAEDQRVARQFHVGANAMGCSRRHCRRGGNRFIAVGEAPRDGLTDVRDADSPVRTAALSHTQSLAPAS